MKHPTHVTKSDTPAAKRRTPAPPPIDRVEEEDDKDKTIPMPEDWFKTRDELYGQPR